MPICLRPLIPAFSACSNAVEKTNPVNATVYETTTSEVTTITTTETSETVVQEPTIKPDLLQIRNICELATLKCSYNNVAKSTKEPGTGAWHLFDKKRTFWIEYSGTVDIGIDLTKIKMDLNEQTITITIPKAQILDIKVDPYDKDAYVISNDGKKIILFQQKIRKMPYKSPKNSLRNPSQAILHY